jgi:hypothetical protein
MVDFRKWTLALFAVSLLLFCQGCSDSALTTLSKGMVDISAADQAVTSTVITAQTNGTMTADEARPILEITLQIAQAGKQVDATIAGLSSLTPAQKQSVLPTIQTLADGITKTTATLNISNAAVKTAVLASLTTMQVALATITVALGK